MGIHYLLANVVTTVSTLITKTKTFGSGPTESYFLKREVWNELTERRLVCFRILSFFIQSMTGGCPERHNQFTSG